MILSYATVYYILRSSLMVSRLAFNIITSVVQMIEMMMMLISTIIIKIVGEPMSMEYVDGTWNSPFKALDILSPAID